MPLQIESQDLRDTYDLYKLLLNRDSLLDIQSVPLEARGDDYSRWDNDLIGLLQELKISTTLLFPVMVYNKIKSPYDRLPTNIYIPAEEALSIWYAGL